MAYLALLVLIILCLFVVSLSKYGNKLYWFFELAHFLGGFFMAMFLSNFFSSQLFILLGVFMVGLLWELWELIVNKSNKLQQFLIKHFSYYIDKITWPDTLLDLFLDILGALVFINIF